MPSHIILYEPATDCAVDLAAIAGYLSENLPKAQVEKRSEFFADYLRQNQKALIYLAEQFAQARVRNPFRVQPGFQPLRGEVEYERRRLEGKVGKAFGIAYDGLRVESLASALLSGKERDTAQMHLIFMDQLLGTWDASDRRFHLRSAIYGFPSLISLPGIVEAPAKPREFYFLKQQLGFVGDEAASLLQLDEEFKGAFLKHGDERLTEVSKGYVLQALFFHACGEPFCEDYNCRLFNAHWQSELLRAQFGGSYEVCPRHQRSLEEMGS